MLTLSTDEVRKLVERRIRDIGKKAGKVEFLDFTGRPTDQIVLCRIEIVEDDIRGLFNYDNMNPRRFEGFKAPAQEPA